MITETKESDKSVELFLTFLNLNPFRVRLLGLFELSNSWFLIMFSETRNAKLCKNRFTAQISIIVKDHLGNSNPFI
ncbi:uncharacterized protein Dana_GF26836 [Drosophila ananassae]|uniref:Uncharacterized protein n=1 Tax=Drosophila ananassae TaxID=7217 RepID=A0A0P8XXA7_DROAN|nr:uncharacterized protein Dana_GF26836 [Drosophila ananassae]